MHKAKSSSPRRQPTQPPQSVAVAVEGRRSRRRRRRLERVREAEVEHAAVEEQHVPGLEVRAHQPRQELAAAQPDEPPASHTLPSRPLASASIRNLATFALAFASALALALAFASALAFALALAFAHDAAANAHVVATDRKRGLPNDRARKAKVAAAAAAKPFI
jgi:Flp pilus assembly protein TadB